MITVRKEGSVTVVFTTEEPRERTDIRGISKAGDSIHVPELGSFVFADFTDNFGTLDIDELFTYFNTEGFFQLG